MRIPVERMTNWELLAHLPKRLKLLDEYSEEHCPNTREALLTLEAQIDEAVSLLRGFAEEHGEGTGLPCSILHGGDES